MRDFDSIPANESKPQCIGLDEVVQHLRERSLQLQEYSRTLRERSEEINRRVQSCLNSRRAA